MLALLAVSVFAASFNSILLHRAKLGRGKSVFLFHLLCSAVWCVCLLLVNGGRLHLERDVLFWGVIYGIVQALFIFFKAKAMSEGPVCITTLIGNCSLLVSVFVCLLIWHEPISLADGIGLALLTVGILLSTYKRSGGQFSKRWLIYAVLFLALGAGVGIVFKAFAKAGSTRAGDMMLVAALVMLVLYVLLYLLGGPQRTDAPKDHQSARAFLLTALFSGLLSCAYNRLNIYLSGKMIATVFFPGFNGGVVVLSTLFGIWILRERAYPRQYAGILLGLAGICIIGIL